MKLVRTPRDLPQQPSAPPARHRRWRIVLIAAIAVVVVLLLFLKNLDIVYTDALWFSSVNMGEVWHTLFVVKLGLFFGFGAICFLLSWVNLAAADRLAPSALSIHPSDAGILRYRAFMARHAVPVRTAAAVLLAALVGGSAVPQWQNWLYFIDGASFKWRDPHFHMNASFYVFKLPFLGFVVSWLFSVLLIVIVLVLVESVAVGGIRFHGERPRVTPQVKAHLSLLLAAVIIDRAVAYYLGRFSLVTGGHGYVQGAGYTDVHVLMPALELLIWVSIASGVVLLFNVRRPGWVLPALSVGLWIVISVVVGGIFPAIVQALKVNPAQSTLERPYIQQNIAATNFAMGTAGVKVVPFAANSQPTAGEVQASTGELADSILWNPGLTVDTFQKLQAIRSYYTFQLLALDRYNINGVETPVVVGVRQVDSTSLPTSGWVNTHLEYTHGYGAVVALASSATPAGTPVVAAGNVPPSYSDGFPAISQPSVYYGAGMSGYVIADTKQPEIDYQLANGTQKFSHYTGSGGVPVGSFWSRLAFALRFGDTNILFSNLIDSRSKIMFVRDINQRIEKAAPFLQVGSNPYPVISGGRIYWIVNGYTTSSNFPYAQDANTNDLPLGAPLRQSNFNYVRASVKVVVDAYTGKMTYYAADQSDPILQTWEKAFPHLFHSMASMPSALRSHLRYPKDLFTIQAAMIGRYRIQNASQFYSLADAWSVSQSPGSGPAAAQLGTTLTTNAQGQIVSTGQVARMEPEYEMIQPPGATAPQFDLVDSFVPVSQGGAGIQTLAGFMVGGSGSDNYGQLTMYQAPAGQSIDGPSLVDAKIQATADVSRQITLLGQNGSQVILGDVAVVPVGQSMLYLRPLYVQSSRNALPILDDVIAVLNNDVAMAPTLQAAVSQVLGSLVSLGGQPSGSGTVTPGSGTVQTSAARAEAAQLAAEAASVYKQAEADLKAGNLGAYESDVTKLGNLVDKLDLLYGEGTSSGGAGGSGTAGAGTAGAGTVGAGSGSGSSSVSGSSGSSGGGARAGPGGTASGGAGSGAGAIRSGGTASGGSATGSAAGSSGANNGTGAGPAGATGSGTASATSSGAAGQPPHTATSTTGSGSGATPSGGA